MVHGPRTLQTSWNMVYLQPARYNGQWIPSGSCLYQPLWCWWYARVEVAVYHRRYIYHPRGLDRILYLPRYPWITQTILYDGP